MVVKIQGPEILTRAMCKGISNKDQDTATNFSWRAWNGLMKDDYRFTVYLDCIQTSHFKSME